MKFENLIVQYLFENKSVTLQNIGTFILADGLNFHNTDKDFVLPHDAVTFNYDPYAGLDDGLIDFVVSHTRKIKPLATSDLESFCITSREYINIGKPLQIEGLGILQKGKDDKYEFIAGVVSNQKVTENLEVQHEKKPGEISFSTPPRKSSKGKNILIGAIILLILLAVPVAIIYFYDSGSKQNVQSLIADTTIKRIEPVATILKDTTSYMIVIKSFNNEMDANNQLLKYNNVNNMISVYKEDSIHFDVGIEFQSANDSIFLKDSINKAFGIQSYIKNIQKR